MKADEYDTLIADPSNYWQRFYLPRVFGALEPWTTLSPFTDLVEGPMTGPFFIPFGSPPVQEMLKKMVEAGDAALEWVAGHGAMDGKSMATLRHARPLPAAPPRRPTTSSATPCAARAASCSTSSAGRRRCSRPASGSSRWPSTGACAPSTSTGTRSCSSRCTRAPTGSSRTRTSARFYWPTLKAVLLGLIEEGIVPLVFAEGGYNERLEAINDPEIPAGRMIWMFDATDMGEAKQPSRRLPVHRRQRARRAAHHGHAAGRWTTTCKQLLADVAGDGGFILGSGIVIDEARPECVKAMIDAGLRYGAEV